MLQSVTKTGEFIDIPDVSGVVNRVENLLDDVIAFLGVDEAEQLEAAGEAEFAKLTRVTADVREALNQGTGLVSDLRSAVEEQRPNIQTTFEKIHAIEDAANDLVADLDAVLTENRAPLNETVVGVRDTVAGAEDLIANAQEIVVTVKGVVDNVADRLEGLVSTLEGTLANTEVLSGEARAFLEENRSAIDSTVIDLRETIRNLREFTRVLADQPNSVIRGRTPQGRIE
jgi:ABC-type transporter Mla subunit MlaD